MVEVDYYEAFQAFVDTFLEVAKDLVPVDTGYLKSTIEADTDGYSAWAEASAEYAQYVEYGTWTMDEQPYFRPALEQAMAVFRALAGEAKSLAESELEHIFETVIQSAQTTMGFFGGTLFAVGMFFLFFPVIVNLYGILDSTVGILTGATDRGGMGPGGLPEIVIT